MGGAEWLCDQETMETRETRRAVEFAQKKTWLHGDNEGDKELQECWDGVDQLQELYFSILFSGGQGHDS